LGTSEGCWWCRIDLLQVTSNTRPDLRHAAIHLGAGVTLNAGGWFELSAVRINYFAIPGRIKSLKRRKPRGNDNNAGKDEVRA